MSRLVFGVFVVVLLGASALVVERIEPAGYWTREVRDGWVRLFTLDGEGNVPTWYSSLLLAACAVLAGLRSRGAPWRRHWRVLAVAFLALSMDEVASIHEMSLKPIRAVFDPRGFLYYVWIVPVAGLLLAALPFFLRFLRALAPPVRRRMVLGAIVLATGSLGVEAVTGWLMDRSGPGLAYALTVLVEEALEMLGVVAMLSGLLLEVQSALDPARSPVARGPSSPPPERIQAAPTMSRVPSSWRSENGA